MERMNQLLEEYLQHYVTPSQRNRLDLVDSTLFCYNLHFSSTTSFSPFKLAMGYEPLTSSKVALQKREGTSLTAYHFARNKQEVFDKLRIALLRQSGV